MYDLGDAGIPIIRGSVIEYDASDPWLYKSVEGQRMLYFDGVDDFMHIPEESEGNGYLRLFHTMTISAWVLRKPGGNATQNLLSKFDKNAAEGFDQKLYV